MNSGRKDRPGVVAVRSTLRTSRSSERDMHLITGGTGIVGIHLLHLLTSSGNAVRALVRPGTDRRIVERVFRHYTGDPSVLLARITWVEGDLHDMPSLEDAMIGVDRVYHAAALVSFDPRDLRELRRTNVEGTANVVNAALNAGVDRLCHVSSTASMGRAEAGKPVDESLPWIEDADTSPYALSKYEAELEVQRGIAEGLDAVIANPSVVIGPGFPGRSSMTLAERLQRGTRFHPTGSNGFVDARDVAQALVLLMEKGATGDRHLIVGGAHSYEELFGMHAASFGHPRSTRPLWPWVLALAWRFERLRTMITRQRPMITRHTVHSSMDQRTYDAGRIMGMGMRFRPVQEAVDNVARFLKAADHPQ